MSKYNHSILRGNIINGEFFQGSIAKLLYQYACEDPDINNIECRRNGKGQEILKCQIKHLHIADVPEYNIRTVEEIAVVCHNDEEPNVYAIREDFPLGLPHSNITDSERPVWLCISDVPFNDIKIRFNAVDFYRSIRRWMKENSYNRLHEEDRPLEPYFITDRICEISPAFIIPGDYLVNTQEVMQKKYRITKTNDLNATHLMISVIANPKSGTSVHKIPEKLSDLEDFFVSENNIPNYLINRISSSPLQFVWMKILIHLVLPRKRPEKDDSYDSFIIAVDKRADDISSLYKSLSPEHFTKVMNETKVNMINVHYGASKDIFNIMNGSEHKDFNISIIGVGSLGGNILELLVKSGIVSNTTIVDPDILLPHNLARHQLQNQNIMDYKVKGFFKRYAGIEGISISPINKKLSACNEKEQANIFQSKDIIIDASTSIEVERILAFRRDDKVRRCTVFLNPKGDDIVLMLEDMERQTTLDILEMDYYWNLINDERLSHHLDGANKEHTNSFSCRSDSNIMDYCNIATLSGVASKCIKESMCKNEQKLFIWHIDEETGEVNKIDLKTSLWKRYQDGDTTLLVSSNAIKQMTEYRQNNLPKETGGELFGAYDVERHIIYIILADPAPIDSISSETSFIRGIAGTEERIKLIQERTFGQVTYLGEWHSHTDRSNAPSTTDDKQFKIQVDELHKENLPFVQLIISEEGIFVRGKE